MGFYTQQPKFEVPRLKDAGGEVSKGFQGVGKTFIDLGNIQEDKEKKKQFEADKIAKIGAFRKIHPKTTEGLTDDEVYQMGDYINKLHTDSSPYKFSKSFTAENGDVIGIFTDGSRKQDGEPNYKRIVLGRAKDFQKAKNSDNDMSVNEYTQYRLKKTRERLDLKAKNKTKKSVDKHDIDIKQFEADAILGQKKKHTIKTKPKTKTKDVKIQMGKNPRGKEMGFWEGMRNRIGFKY